MYRDLKLYNICISNSNLMNLSPTELALQSWQTNWWEKLAKFLEEALTLMVTVYQTLKMTTMTMMVSLTAKVKRSTAGKT